MRTVGLALMWLAAMAVPAWADTGAELFDRKGCVGCHTLKGHPGADGTMGPNLSKLYKAKPPRDAGELAAYLRQPHRARPDSPMPRLALTAAEAQALVSYVLSARRGGTR